MGSHAGAEEPRLVSTKNQTWLGQQDLKKRAGAADKSVAGAPSATYRATISSSGVRERFWVWLGPDKGQ